MRSAKMSFRLEQDGSLASKTCSKLWAFQPTCVQVGSRGNKVLAIPRVLNQPHFGLWVRVQIHPMLTVGCKTSRTAAEQSGDGFRGVSYADFCRRRVCCTRPIPQDAL